MDECWNCRENGELNTEVIDQDEWKDDEWKDIDLCQECYDEWMAYDPEAAQARYDEEQGAWRWFNRITGLVAITPLVIVVLLGGGFSVILISGLLKKIGGSFIGF